MFSRELRCILYEICLKYFQAESFKTIVECFAKTFLHNDKSF